MCAGDLGDVEHKKNSLYIDVRKYVYVWECIYVYLFMKVSHYICVP